MHAPSPQNDVPNPSASRFLPPVSGLGAYWIPGCALAFPLLTGMLFLLRNYLATEGEVTPPLDDTLIYFQYARTFAEGSPFAWLPGGGYSTGATSYLYVLLLAAGYSLGFKGAWLYAFAWSLGLLFFAGAIWRLGLWMERSFGLIPALGGIVAAGSSGLILWCAHSGMDSMLLLLALTVAAESVARLRDGAGVYLPAHALLFALLPLVRPEAAALGCVLALCVIPGGGSSGRRTAGVLLASCLSVIVALALINSQLTGSTATNGVITKSWMTDPTRVFSEQIGMVIGEIGTFLHRFLLPSQAPERALLLPFFLFGSWRLFRDGRQGWLLSVLVVFGITLTLQSSYANVHRNRYQAPFLAMAWMIAGAAFVYGVMQFKLWRGQHGRALAPTLVGVFAVLLLTVAGARDTNAWAWRFALDARDIRRHPVAMGAWLREVVQPEQVVALHDAGAMPYYSQHPRFLDLVGLGTNGMGRWYRSGPGALFERLESLPPEQRPDFFAVYTDWFEDVDIFGSVRHTITLDHVSIVPNPVLHLLEARTDRFGTGHAPWRADMHSSSVLDAVDLADLDSEAAHNFRAGDRPGPTRYLRGTTASGVTGGDGARWVRDRVGFDLSLGEGAKPGAKLLLVFRAAAGASSILRYKVEGTGVSEEGAVELHVGRTLQDYVVDLSPSAGATSLKIWVEPQRGLDLYLARSFIAFAEGN